MSQIVPLLITI